MWNITVVDDSRSKQFSKEKGFTSNGGWAVCRYSGRYTVRRALAIAELSDSDTVSITISLERLVDLTQTVAGLVGQQLDEAVGQENMSSDGHTVMDLGIGGGCFGGTPCEPSRR